MAINLAQHHRALFVPPVELPMELLMNRNLYRGLFGIDRIAQNSVNVATSSGTFTHTPVSCHSGIDLKDPQGKPVFAARRGEVVEVRQTDGTTDNMLIVLRHVELDGNAFTTRYIHLQDPVVAIGDNVRRGQCIAFIGRENHLHFEIRHIMLPGPNDWHWINTEPVDPLPYLYPWEKIYYEHIREIVPQTDNAAKLKEVGVLRKNGIWMYQVKQNNNSYVIPLYDLDLGDEKIVDLLESAYISGKRVRIASRQSPFFGGRRIVTGVRVLES